MNESNKFRLVLVVSILALGLPFTIRPAQSATTDVTFTGVVSCSRCHGLHARKGTNRLSCTTLCVSQDAHYVLIVGDKEYALQGDRDEVQNFGGAEATVMGHLTGDTLDVRNIGRKLHDRQAEDR